MFPERFYPFKSDIYSMTPFISLDDLKVSSFFKLQIYLETLSR